MMRIQCEKRDALRLKVELSRNIDEYARSFLAIYNNVKNDRDLLKMYNDYANNVYVVCEKNVRNAAIEFLEQFGSVVSTEIVEVVQPIGCDYEYREDIDTEFLEVDEL
jgi:hypothetical protein